MPQYPKGLEQNDQGVWCSGQHNGLQNRRSWVRIPPPLLSHSAEVVEHHFGFFFSQRDY